MLVVPKHYREEPFSVAYGRDPADAEVFFGIFGVFGILGVFTVEFNEIKISERRFEWTCLYPFSHLPL